MCARKSNGFVVAGIKVYIWIIHICNVTSAPWQVIFKGCSRNGVDLLTDWRTGVLMDTLPTLETGPCVNNYLSFLAAEFDTLDIDQIKVSVYKDGVERQWITFSGDGASRLGANWFLESNVIDTSYETVSGMSQFDELIKYRVNGNRARKSFYVTRTIGSEDSNLLCVLEVNSQLRQHPYERVYAEPRPIILYSPDGTLYDPWIDEICQLSDFIKMNISSTLYAVNPADNTTFTDVTPGTLSNCLLSHCTAGRQLMNVQYTDSSRTVVSRCFSPRVYSNEAEYSDDPAGVYEVYYFHASHVVADYLTISILLKYDNDLTENLVVNATLSTTAANGSAENLASADVLSEYSPAHCYDAGCDPGVKTVVMDTGQTNPVGAVRLVLPQNACQGDVAAGGEVTLSTLPSGVTPNDAVDGDPLTCVQTDPEAAPWVTMDLRATTDVSYVSFTTGYTTAAPNHAVAMATVHVGSVGDTSDIICGNIPGPFTVNTTYHVFCDEAVPGQFVTVVWDMAATGQMDLCTLEVIPAGRVRISVIDGLDVLQSGADLSSEAYLCNNLYLLDSYGVGQSVECGKVMRGRYVVLQSNDSLQMCRIQVFKGSSEQYAGSVNFVDDVTPSGTNDQFILPQYTVSAPGTLIGWAAHVTATGSAYFQIWRNATGSQNLTLIGQTLYPAVTMGNQHVELDAVDLFEVEEGDIIGYYHPSVGILGASMCTGLTLAVLSPGAVTVGQELSPSDVSAAPTCHDFSLRAVIQPYTVDSPWQTLKLQATGECILASENNTLGLNTDCDPSNHTDIPENQWKLDRAGRLINKARWLCLDSDLTLSDCYGLVSGTWSNTSVDGVWYTLENFAMHRCLAGGAAGGFEMVPCDSADASQLWQFTSSFYQTGEYVGCYHSNTVFPDRYEVTTQTDQSIRMLDHPSLLQDCLHVHCPDHLYVHIDRYGSCACSHQGSLYDYLPDAQCELDCVWGQGASCVRAQYVYKRSDRCQTLSDSLGTFSPEAECEIEGTPVGTSCTLQCTSPGFDVYRNGTLVPLLDSRDVTCVSASGLYVWDGDLHCNLTTCDLALGNGTIDVTDHAPYYYGDVIELVCDFGYVPESDDSSLECATNRTWNGTVLTCHKIVCTDPGVPDNVAVVHWPATLTYLEIIVYSCVHGYYLSAGSVSVHCTQNETWSDALPVCLEIVCQTPAFTESHIVYNQTITDLPSNFSMTSRLQVTCAWGYSPLGESHIIECGADKQWNDSIIQCDAIDCGLPADGVATDLLYTNHSYAGQVVYTCLEGYTNASGDESRVCTEAGWSGVPLVCQEIQCGPPSPVDNASLSTSGHTYNSTATYSCYYGYQYLSGNRALTCSVSGIWAPIDGEIQCQEILCGSPPVAQNASLVNITGHGVGDSAGYGCNHGYVYVTGNMTTACGEDGQWTDVTLSCQVFDCESVPQVYGAEVSMSDARTALYSCGADYIHKSGSVSVSICQSDGIWSLVDVICMDRTCPDPMPLLPPNTVVLGDVSVTVHSIISLECAAGYQAVTGATTWQCGTADQWEYTSALDCVEVTCPTPTPLPGVSCTAPKLTVNSSLVCQCEAGYDVISGNTSRVCVHPGVWSGNELRCNEIMCPLLQGNWTHLEYFIDSYTPGSNGLFLCLNDMDTIGPSQLYCNGEGRWDIQLPTCHEKSCGEPPTSDTATYSYTSLGVGAIAQYNCLPNYNLTTASNVITCSSSLDWVGEIPQCTEIKCPDPTINQHTYLTQLGSQRVGDQLVYACDQGYSVSEGLLVRRCLENGTWAGHAPTCKEVDCGVPPKVLFASRYTDPGARADRHIVHYTCYYGYKLSHGSLTKFCASDGNWTGEDPVCIVDKAKATYSLLKEEVLTNEERLMLKFGFTEADKRPSAIATGTLGIVFVILAFILILVLDIPHIRRDFKQRMRPNVRSRCCYHSFYGHVIADVIAD